MAEKEQKANERIELMNGIVGITHNEDGSLRREVPIIGKIAIGHPAGWVDRETGEIFKAPKSLNHFVFKKRAGNNHWVIDDELTELYGAGCKEIVVILPAKTVEGNFRCHLELWGKGTGLMCEGDGSRARRWFKGKYETGLPKLASPVEAKCPCDLCWVKGRDPEATKNKKPCQPSMTLYVVLAKEEVLTYGAVWKFTSGGYHNLKRFTTFLDDIWEMAKKEQGDECSLRGFPFWMKVVPFAGHRTGSGSGTKTQTNYAIALIYDTSLKNELQYSLLRTLTGSGAKMIESRVEDANVEVLDEPESMRTEEQTKEFREQPKEKKEETAEQKKAGDNLFDMEKEPSEPPKAAEKKEEGPPPSPPPPESEHSEPERDDLSDIFGE